MALEFSISSSIPRGEQICDQHGGEIWLTRMGVIKGDFLTLNSKEKVVKWYGSGGNEVKRVYSITKIPTMAIFCYLNVSVDLMCDPSPSQKIDRQLAVAILTNEDIMHIYMYTGEHFDIILPSVMEKILSTPFGLILQSQDSSMTAVEEELEAVADILGGDDDQSSGFEFLQSGYNNNSTSNILSPSPSRDATGVLSLSGMSPGFGFEGDSKPVIPGTINGKKLKNSQIGQSATSMGGCQLFSLTSPYAPIRMISSSDLDDNGTIVGGGGSSGHSGFRGSFFTGQLLACYDSLIVVYLPFKKEVAVSAITLSNDRYRLLATEEDRRRSVENSMNQSSFLEKSGYSDQSNRSNRSNRSGNSNQNLSNTSNKSQQSGGSGSHQSQRMSVNSAFSSSKSIKKPFGQTQRERSRSTSPRINSAAPSPFPLIDPANTTAVRDSDYLQSMILGPKQSSFFGRNHMTGGVIGGTNLPAGALSMNRTTSPMMHMPFHGPASINSNTNFKAIQDHSVSALSCNLDLDFTSDELKLNTFHNENFFQYEPELHIVSKSAVKLEDMATVTTSSSASAGELSLNEIESMFQSVQTLCCRVSGALTDLEGVALNLYDPNEAGNVVHFIIQAAMEDLEENPWPSNFGKVGLSIAVTKVIKVTDFKTKSIAALTVSYSRLANHLDTTMAIPIYFLHQEGKLNLAYTVGLNACYRHFPIELEDDTIFIKALVGQSNGDSGKLNSASSIGNIAHISSTSEYIAVQYTNETKIVRVTARNHGGSPAMRMIFFDIFKSFRSAYKCCNLQLNGFIGLWLALSHELDMNCDLMLLMLFSAMLDISFESCLQFLKTLDPPVVSLASRDPQMLKFSYGLFQVQVSALKEKESCAILSFGLLVLTTQSYRLQNTILVKEKCDVVDRSISLIWNLVSQVDNFQAQALCTAYCGIILANENYLEATGVMEFIRHLSSHQNFEVLRRILVINGMKETFRPFSMTWCLLEKLLTSTSNSDDVSHVWSLKIVSAFIETVHQIHENVEGNEELFRRSMEDLPIILQQVVMIAMQQSKGFALSHWPVIVLEWIGRNDLVANKLRTIKWSSSHTSTASTSTSKPTVRNGKPSDGEVADAASDGLDDIIADSLLRFPGDERLKEVCRMLKSSTPNYLKVERTPDASEMDYRAKQQNKLLMLLRRSLALPTGRGMVTISSLEPLMAEALPIPNVSTSGRAPPNNSIVALDSANASSDITLWAEFNNGVASAFRVGPKISPSGETAQHDSGSSSGHSHTSNLQRITRNWIIYNKTASQSKQNGEKSHAGFLFGLGLFGHLNVLTIADMCDYLTQGHEPTTIGVLIGVAASKIGTADSLLSKTLCLHLPSLLPAQHWDIEISPMVQCAAIVGLGFLYCRSGHRLIIQFLLEELTRRPTSDRCKCRESLALAAAWALGMVLLPKDDIVNTSNTASSNAPVDEGNGPSESQHDTLNGFSDLKIEDRLHLLISGGKRPPQSNLFPFHEGNQDPSAKSSKVMEGDVINVDVTAPAATVAIALIYMRSNNQKILRRLAIPTTAVELDGIRPDHLIFRGLAQCIVRWEDGIVPSKEWIEDQVPQALRVLLPKMTSASGLPGQNDEQHDYQGPYGASRRHLHSLNHSTVFTLYIHLITGYCTGMGIVYAGTFNQKAKETLLHYLSFMQKVRDNKLRPKLSFFVDKTIKHMVEICTASISLALGCVMAGSGDVECLRIMRELRWKVDDTGFGTHMAFGMSLGMLFLAGGRYSLRRDPVSIACLLLSIIPRFPAKTTDHQYHLQPLRHLYALAVEPRVLHTIDVDTGLPVSVNLEVELKSGETRIVQAPGLLPELNTVHRIKLAKSVTNKYYQCSMDLDHTDNTILRQDVILSEDDIALSSKTKVLRRRYIMLPTLFVKQIGYSSNIPTSTRSLVIGKDVVKSILGYAFGSNAKKTSAAIASENGDNEIRKHEEALNGSISKILFQSSLVRNALLSVIQK